MLPPSCYCTVCILLYNVAILYNGQYIYCTCYFKLLTLLIIGKNNVFQMGPSVRDKYVGTRKYVILDFFIIAKMKGLHVKQLKVLGLYSLTKTNKKYVSYNLYQFCNFRFTKLYFFQLVVCLLRQYIY